MSEPALQYDFISEEEYLFGEELTEISHEYLDGRVYAMSVPTDTHGEIAGSVFAALSPLLAGKRCRPWFGNMRVRIGFPKVVFYIPDVLVACDDPPRDARFREQPLAIWEVISESTKAIDRREKLQAYTTLPTLRHYFIAQQERMEVTHVRREGPGWKEFVFSKADQRLEVPEIGFGITLADMYAEAGL